MSKTGRMTIRNAVLGCMAGLLLCSSVAVMPAGAVTVTAKSDYGMSKTPDIDASAEKDIANVATVESYSAIPESVMDANLRNCLQLLDLTFAQSGFSEEDAVTGSTTAFMVTRDGKFAGFDIYSMKVIYDSVETGNEKPVKLYIDTADFQPDGSEETQEIIDVLAEAFGIEDIEGTTEPFTGVNCAVLLHGVELVFAVSNTQGMIEIEITRSSAHSEEPAQVDKSLLESLIVEAWGYSSSDYTADSHAAMKSHISAGGIAATVYDNPDATAMEVIEACNQLGGAIDNLVMTGVLSFTPEEFTKLMNTALDKVNDRAGTGYLALSTTGDDGSLACLVCDKNNNFNTVFYIIFYDKNSNNIYDSSVHVSEVMGFSPNVDVFAVCSIALVMAVDSSASISTALDISENTANAALYYERYSYNGIDWLFGFVDDCYVLKAFAQ